jgi:hypothetical protein
MIAIARSKPLDKKRAKRLLVQVAKGKVATHKLGLISYKEFWERLSSDRWGQGCARKIRDLISQITKEELAAQRFPLNELVVLKRNGKKGKKGEPGEEWDKIREYHQRESHILMPYNSHREAQEACRRYWRREHDAELTDEQVEEGLKQDKTARFRKRNAKIVALRKERDEYTCQACGFWLNANGKYIIDCHHTKPFDNSDQVRITVIEDLVCLCPTCHRIAHTRQYHPLSVQEIKGELKVAKECRAAPH